MKCGGHSGFKNEKTRREAVVRLKVRQVLNFAIAIADLFRLHARHIQHRKEQVSHRRPLLITKVPSTLQLSARSTGHQCRQIKMFMPVAVAQAAAIDNK